MKNELKIQFDKLVNEQVTHIKKFFDKTSRRITYHRCTKTTNAQGKHKYEMHETLDLEWIAENFSHKEPFFYKKLINAKAGTIHEVPQGSSRELETSKPERVDGAPIIKYEQQGMPTCVVCSFSSALHASGDVHYAEIAHSWVEESLQIVIGKRTANNQSVYKDRLDYVVEKSRRKPKQYVAKKREKWVGC